MKRKRWIWIGVVVAMIVVSVGGYVVYRRVSAAQVAQQPTIQTATVSRGDIVLSALGSGVLLPEREIDLTFGVDGRVVEVLVAVGDEVHQGDVLARLDTMNLERAVAQAQASLRQAQINLEEATAPPDEVTLQAAQDAVDQAAAALRLQRINYSATMSSTLIVSSLPDAQENYAARLEEYNDWLKKYNEGEAAYWYVDRAQQQLEDARYALVRLQQQVDQTVQSANNELAAAVAQYNQALANLRELQAGADPLTVESLQLQVQAAELELTVAQENLARATLVAPFDGIVTAVAVQEGETVGGSTAAVTLADMNPPLIEFWVEEADMAAAVVGNPVSVVFEALPDLTYTGQIIRVEPTLVTVGNTTAVQIWATLDTSAHSERLFSGMNAEVEVIYGEARNALLVPVDALRLLGSGQYAVFVVNSAGELELRPVEIGLQDYVNAQVLSGLSLGEVVSVATEDTSLASSPAVNLNNPQFPGAGGGIFIPGGGPP